MSNSYLGLRVDEEKILCNIRCLIVILPSPPPSTFHPPRPPLPSFLAITHIHTRTHDSFKWMFHRVDLSVKIFLLLKAHCLIVLVISLLPQPFLFTHPSLSPCLYDYVSLRQGISKLVQTKEEDNKWLLNKCRVGACETAKLVFSQGERKK